MGCIKPLCDLLTVMDSKIVQVALNGLENILRLGEQEAKRNGTGINPYCALIEEAYGKIKSLLGVLKLFFLHAFLACPHLSNSQKICSHTNNVEYPELEKNMHGRCEENQVLS